LLSRPSIPTAIPTYFFEGYARVSTDGQSVADQVAALKAAATVKVYAEKQSGAKSDSLQLAKAIPGGL
jgi:DNA invertase Pin-like site-specific DNA recombinase